jgi:HAE1 family hydrophobic/amphiphilic exporter-1
MTLLALSVPARAEGLSRAEAVAMAVRSNPDVRKSVADLAILDGRGREALADALPELTLIGWATRYRDPGLLNSSSFDSFPAELRDSLTPIPANLYESVATVKQTLFSFKLGRAIRAARFGQALGREQVRQSERSIALDAIQAYNAHLLGLERVRVTEKAVRQKEKHLEMARNRRQAGVATELDVLRSEVDVENQRTELLRARGQVELARGLLNSVMLRPIDDPVDPTDSLTYVAFETTLDEAVREALAHRPEMKAADLMLKAREELVGVARAESRPRLDFVAAWGYSVRKPGNFLDANFQKWNAGITLTVPVFDGFRTAGKVAQAQGERDKAAQDETATGNRIRLDAKEAFDRLRVARSILEAAELNVAQAQKAADMTQANYNLGAATTLDVLDTQAALTLAESNRVQALYEHANARAALRYVMGRDPLDPANGER